MEWYLPITILPAVGMIILSTVNQMVTLSSEINDLLSNQCNEFQHEIADKKIRQLGLLTRATALLYVSCGCYVLAGIFSIVSMGQLSDSFPLGMLAIGSVLVFLAISLLIIYAFRAVSIRQMQFDYSRSQMKKSENLLK